MTRTSKKCSNRPSTRLPQGHPTELLLGEPRILVGRTHLGLNLAVVPQLRRIMWKQSTVWFGLDVEIIIEREEEFTFLQSVRNRN